MNLKIKVGCKVADFDIVCVRTAVLLMFSALIYSYWGTNWEVGKYGILFRYANTSSNLYLFCVNASLVLILMACVRTFRKCRLIQWFMTLLLVGSIILSIALTICDNGLTALLYVPTAPQAYLLIFGFIIGESPKLWNAINKLIFPLSCILLILILKEYLHVTSRYGVSTLGNSSIIYYYVTLFWLVAIYCCHKLLKKKRISTKEWVFLAFLNVFSLIINSRSWIIQAFLLTACMYLCNPSKKTRDVKLKRLFVFGLIVIVAVYVIAMLFPENIKMIINKLSLDSRSDQYFDILPQMNFSTWIMGNGMLATYTTHMGVQQRNIDNVYLFTIFHFGLVILIPYVYFYITAILHGFRAKNISNAAVFILVLWLMALGGLSIFNVVYLDLKSMLLPMLAGNIYHCALEQGGGQ